jgi:hypothetical protein
MLDSGEKVTKNLQRNDGKQIRFGKGEKNLTKTGLIPGKSIKYIQETNT